MKKLPSIVIALSVAAIVVNCKKEEKNQDFSQITKNYFDDKNALDPLTATQNGQNQFNGDLQLDMTDGYRASQKAFYEKYETAISKIDTTSLTDDEKISYKIISWETSIGKNFLQQPTNLMPIHQFWGTHLTMAQYAGGTSAQPFKTEKDYTDFLSRMEKYGTWLDSAMVYMKKGIEKGIVLPKALTVKVIPQFETMITPKVEDNQFYTVIKSMPASFSDAVKKDLASKYANTIQNKLMPHYQKMTQFLKSQYLPASRKTSGYGDLPNGKAMYADFVKLWTTTSMTPDEIHELGLKEVARIKLEMEKVKAQVGFKGTLQAFFENVRNKKELKPFKKPEQVIANFESIYSRIKPNVDKLFSLQPKTKFEIRRTEAFREKTSSAEYNQGAADGSRPGIFFVPIPDVANYNVYTDEDLFLHEAVPGHHFQVSLQQENANLPDFRKFNWFGAYGEGWALYTESLGKELGLYQDPYQYFGMLGNEMHRAVRLVVDTGIHSKGWSREQAIKYSLENEAESEASITTSIERYMAIPGQALSYKIGQLKILELRKKATSQLGNNFDIKKFHEKVLESGVLPLALLEEKINNWIAILKK
jgi:uncharacterized protein (DUF885 family)